MKRTHSYTAPVMSAADKAAHRAASYVRPTDSDPDMDEALRRVQTNLAYLQRDRQLAAEVAAQIQMGTAA